MTSMTRQWFAVAAHRRRSLAEGPVTWVPAGTTHAKELGANVTACGLLATTWQIFWDVSPRSIDTDLCAACWPEVVAGGDAG